MVRYGKDEIGFSEIVGLVHAEKAAHRFAGAFLMPAEALWSEVGKRRTAVGWDELFKLKQLSGVSVQALTYRCKDLGMFNRTLFRLRPAPTNHGLCVQ